MQEIQNDWTHHRVKESLLALPMVSNPINVDDFLTAQDIFRKGRKKGITMRSSIDCLIAAIALKNEYPVLHFDRDFDLIARFTSLETRKTI